jgi:pentatricopeptide repeat protein
LLAEGLVANLAVFNALIFVCGEVRDMEGAFRVLKEMGRAGVPPDVRCYTRLLRACGVDAESRGSKAGAGAGVDAGEGAAASATVGSDLSSEIVAVGIPPFMVHRLQSCINSIINRKNER